MTRSQRIWSKACEAAGFLESVRKSFRTLSFTVRTVIIMMVVGVMLFGGVSLVKKQLSISEKQRILDDLNAQIEQQQLENQELERKLDSNLDKDIEAYARDKLDMVKPGERVYINTAGN